MYHKENVHLACVKDAGILQLFSVDADEAKRVIRLVFCGSDTQGYWVSPPSPIPLASLYHSLYSRFMLWRGADWVNESFWLAPNAWGKKTILCSLSAFPNLLSSVSWVIMGQMGEWPGWIPILILSLPRYLLLGWHYLSKTQASLLQKAVNVSKIYPGLDPRQGRVDMGVTLSFRQILL